MNASVSADAFRQFICRACGYIYDEALGDPDGGLVAGTRYEDIPDDWMCPTCGVGKSDFEPYVVADIAAMAKPAVPVARRGAADPVVIVGGGIAAWSVARALRAHDAGLPITMLSGCRADVYQKPMLSVACAQGKSPQEMVSSTGADCAAQLSIQLIPETWMVGLDTAHKRIRTTRGTFAYRDLVIATGAAPASLPLDAQSLTNIWRINHLNEYAAFRQRLTIKGSEPCDIVIIGAGLVGCELADDLASLGHRCTLLEAAVQPLMGLATPAKADELIDAYAKAGIRIHTGTRVSSVQRAGAGYMVHCSYGLISADLVIAATGLRTEGRVAQSAGLAFDNGYAVDAASMRTSDAHVYALGDCASFSGKAYRFIEPIHRQAEVIAAQISGAPTQGFAVRPVPVRLKSRTLPMTFQMAA